MKVFIAQPIQANGVKMLEEIAEVKSNPEGRPLERQEFLSQITDVDAVILPWHTDIMDKEAFAAAKNLKVIGRHGVGYENIDLVEATKRGVYVTYCPVHTPTVADTAFALIMVAGRRLSQADQFVKDGKWDIGGEWVAWKFLGVDIHDKTMGVIGAGRIGSEVLRRGTGFRMELLYYDLEDKVALEKETGATRVSLETLLKKADFVSINTNLTPETTHLIGAKELRMMKNNAVLVNTSRGPAIDQDALYQALKNGEIAAAGLDVYVDEPLPVSSKLRELDNVILLPHIGSAALEMREKMARITCQSVIDALTGREPEFMLNPEVRKVNH